jgi:hypothetical protein
MKQCNLDLVPMVRRSSEPSSHAESEEGRYGIPPNATMRGRPTINNDVINNAGYVHFRFQTPIDKARCSMSHKSQTIINRDRIAMSSMVNKIRVTDPGIIDKPARKSLPVRKGGGIFGAWGWNSTTSCRYAS